MQRVDNNFEAYEEFIGMHVVDSIDASTLYHVIKDVLLCALLKPEDNAMIVLLQFLVADQG